MRAWRRERERARLPFYRHKEGRCTCTGGGEVIVIPRIGGMQWVTTVESTLWGPKEHGSGHGGRPGRRPWSCGDRTGVLAAPASGVVVVVEGTVLCARRGGVPRVLQVGVLIGSRFGLRPRVVPMPFEGPAAEEVHGVGNTVEGAAPSTSA